MKPIREDSAPESLVPAMEANRIAFWSAYGPASQVTLHADAQLVWFYTGIPFPLFNGVLFAQVTPDVVKVTIAALRVHIQAQGAPALWWIGPQTQPTRLGALLEQAGLHPAGEVPGMAMALVGLTPPAELPPGLTIQKVTTKEAQSVWARTAAVGTGLSEAATAAMVQLEATLSEAPDQPQPRYLGLLDGSPVATSALALAAGVAGIYAVATVPAARGRGIGRAMTVLPLLEARQLGYHVGILQSSELGYPLYRAIGFQDVLRYQLYLQAA